jgi:iron complex transport system substrate-binding protein
MTARFSHLARGIAALGLAALLAAAAPAVAAISVTDDTGAAVTLQRPAQRIVSLAPHATELLFAAGGGARVVGTVTYSDYPPAARDIPRVGDNRSLDLERIAALKPDLVVVWRHGNAQKQLDRLRALGIPL